MTLVAPAIAETTYRIPPMPQMPPVITDWPIIKPEKGAMTITEKADLYGPGSGWVFAQNGITYLFSAHSGNRYEVDAYACTCDAGRRGLHCWHKLEFIRQWKPELAPVKRTAGFGSAEAFAAASAKDFGD